MNQQSETLLPGDATEVVAQRRNLSTTIKYLMRGAQHSSSMDPNLRRTTNSLSFQSLDVRYNGVFYHFVTILHLFCNQGGMSGAVYCEGRSPSGI